MKSSLRQLRAFVATAEHGGTSAAARALNLSQPSVSVAVRELEQVLGVALFRRDPPKRLALTPTGRRKLDQARRLLADVDAFERVSEDSVWPAGPVAFGYFETLGPTHVPALLRRAAAALPEVAVEPVEADLDELHRLVEVGRVELALTYDVGLAGQVEAEPLASFAPYALLPDRHPLARRAEVRLEDLAEQPFILVDLPHSREFLLSAFRARGLAPRIAHRTRSLEMMRGMVANGLGVSLLITRPRGDRAYDGRRIAHRPLAERPPHQSMLLARPQGLRPTAAAAAFADLIRRHYRDGES